MVTFIKCSGSWHQNQILKIPSAPKKWFQASYKVESTLKAFNVIFYSLTKLLTLKFKNENYFSRGGEILHKQITWEYNKQGQVEEKYYLRQ